MVVLDDVPVVVEEAIPVIIHLDDLHDWHFLVKGVLQQHQIVTDYYYDVDNLGDLNRLVFENPQLTKPVIVLVDLRLNESIPVYEGSNWLAENIGKLQQNQIHVIVFSGYLPPPTINYLVQLGVPEQNIITKDPLDELSLVSAIRKVIRQKGFPHNFAEAWQLGTEANRMNKNRLPSETALESTASNFDWEITARLYGHKVVDNVIWVRPGTSYSLELAFKPSEHFTPIPGEDLVLDIFVVGVSSDHSELHWKLPITSKSSKKVFQIEFPQTKSVTSKTLSILIYSRNKLKRIIDYDILIT